MTAGNDGASTPEDDDPFGYLYADGQQSGGAQQRRQGGYGYPGPAAQPGVPRTSYNQVRTVGERQYGGPQQQVPPQGQYPQQPGPYGQQGTPQGSYGQQQAGYGQQQGGYGAPNPHYAAPETQTMGPGAAPRQGPPGGPSGPGQRGGRGSGPNTRGLLIAAVAVVAAVVIGIAIALMTSGSGDSKDDQAGSGASASAGSGASEGPSDKPSASASDGGALPEQDASTLQLSAPAAAATDVPGAKAKGGVYVAMPGVGAAATWTVDVPKGGKYTLFANYGVPGTDAKMSLFVNDQDRRSISMKNFANAPAGAADKGWTTTYSWISLKKGSNTIKISCEQGDQCGVNLDQLSLKAGNVTR
ncbi:carbohydrate-binding protein [Streptomyces fuscigenes]|uniref:carbohydrate-binding protein n=1 Tax=Streptomyces fuscigenes TaxID=1528880 RepID=UPI001F4341D7|nr:carbohydrate-binding protein [Streptomyces fuscigenes]MCF3960570.1 carbohydrate-binding protein [Streptomyces fuscigenes]